MAPFLALAALAPTYVGMLIAHPSTAQRDRLDPPGRRVPHLAQPSILIPRPGWSLQSGVRCWPFLFAWPVAVAFVFPNGRLLSRRWRWVVALGSGLLRSPSSCVDAARPRAVRPAEPTTSGTRCSATMSARSFARVDLGPALARHARRRLFAGVVAVMPATSPLDGRRAPADALARVGGVAHPARRSCSTSAMAVVRPVVDVVDAISLLLLVLARSLGRAIGIAVVPLPAVRDRAAGQSHARLCGADAAARAAYIAITLACRRRSSAAAPTWVDRRWRRLSSRSRSGRCARACRSSSTAASIAPATRACELSRRSRTRSARAPRAPEEIGAVLARGAPRPARRAPLLAARRARRTRPRRASSSQRCRTTGARARRSRARRRAHGGAAARPGAARAAATSLRGILAAAALSVEIARLRVEVRLQLQRSRPRARASSRPGYEERRRLERDLHDGAQQRLVSLGLQIRRMQRSLPARGERPRAGARPDRRRGRIGDRRPAPDRRRRAAGAPRRRPRGRAPRPRPNRPDPGRGRGADRPRRRERRGGGVLRRVRGDHERRQARVARRGRAARRRAKTARCA